MSKEDFPPEVREAFDTYAEDDGTISIKRAKHALQDVIELDEPIKRQEIRSATGAEDFLDWHDFATFCSKKLIQKEKSDVAFRLFDKDGKGMICTEDIERVVKELEEDFTEEEIEEMMGEANSSGDGLINRDDFFRIVRMINL